MSGKIKDIITKAAYIVGTFALIAGFIYALIHDKMLDKKYGTPRYEYVITDKYEDIGSTWHLVGGRASESKYHVVYRYRLTNRPDNKNNLVWYNGETTVSGSRYRELNTGQTLYGGSLFPY